MDSPLIDPAMDLHGRPWVSARDGPPFLRPSRCGLMCGLPREDRSLPVSFADNEIQVGESLTIAFEATLRIPEDGEHYVVPSGLAPLPFYRTEDFADRVPVRWKKRSGIMIPLHPWEATWICLSSRSWRPNAIKVRVGNLNGLTGRRYRSRLSAKPQDYLVCPQEPWIDRVHLGRQGLRQLIAPAYAGHVAHSRIQLAVFEPGAGRFPEGTPHDDSAAHQLYLTDNRAPRALCLGARWPVSEWIQPDPYGIETWDQDCVTLLDVYVMDSASFHEVTGKEPPASPISRRDYESFKIPWPGA